MNEPKIKWQDLLVYDSYNAQYSNTRLGNYIAEAEECELRRITLDNDGRLVSWSDFFVAADGEEPDWDTPIESVDWSGFAEAIEARRKELNYVNHNLDNLFDLDDDNSKPHLMAVWNALDTPVYRVVDENGVNMAGAFIRRLDKKHWLYVDDADGYEVMAEDYAANLLRFVKEEDYVDYGYNQDGSVAIN